MQINEWLQTISNEISWTAVAGQFRNTQGAEWVAVAFGILSVVLASKNNVLLYPCGIVSTSIYVILFFKPDVELYASGLLNLYYLITSVYGWYHWMRKPNRQEIPVSSTTLKEKLITLFIVAVTFSTFYYLLVTFSGSQVPFLDAWVSATACAGMWLLAKRKIENWILLNISNFFAIPLYLYKGFPLTAVLTLILFIVAIKGYFNWKAIQRTQKLEMENV